VVKPPKPKQTVRVQAVRPERDHLAIEFPRVEGYARDLPEQRLSATFSRDSTLTLKPEKTGPTKTRNEGIFGEGVTLESTGAQAVRTATVAFHLASRLLRKHFLDGGGVPRLHLMQDLLRIAREWLDGGYLVCAGGTQPSQLLGAGFEDDACERIHQAIARSAGERRIRVVLDPCNPRGSTAGVDFRTSRQTRWSTSPALCHVNWAVCDGGWELEFCRILESHPRVRAYVKNEGMGFSVPYLMSGISRRYFPDFIVRVDDGAGQPLNLVVEIKGKRKEDAKIKAETMRASWVPGINRRADYGRWDFLELTDIDAMEEDFNRWFAQRAACSSVRAAHGAILPGGSRPDSQDLPRRKRQASGGRG